jgi:hypothetical protein
MLCFYLKEAAFSRSQRLEPKIPRGAMHVAHPILTTLPFLFSPRSPPVELKANAGTTSWWVHARVATCHAHLSS